MCFYKLRYLSPYIDLVIVTGSFYISKRRRTDYGTGGTVTGDETGETEVVREIEPEESEDEDAPPQDWER